VSASEWTDSASIDDEAVSRNATNLVAAMPKLANIAVTTALVLPSVATHGLYGSPNRWECGHRAMVTFVIVGLPGSTAVRSA
jgi:hypothetical protein